MTPVQDAEQSVDEHVPTPIETTSSDVLGDVTWDEFMSFDNELAIAFAILLAFQGIISSALYIGKYGTCSQWTF